MFKTNFVSTTQARDLAAAHGTPLFVYSRDVLTKQAAAMLAVPAPHGLTVRYAMKANPHDDVLKLLREQDIKIDASSGYEAARALTAGFAPADILLTSQQLAHNTRELVEKGVQFNACSLRQLESYGQAFPGSDVSVRINPGIGSGHSVKTNVGGVTSSFGIWHEYIDKIHALAAKYRLNIVRMHTHIGSGTDPAVWQDAARISLELIKNFPSATIIDLGGGFKVARLDGEHGADMTDIGRAMADELQMFAADTGRQLHLELEPGTFMAANMGILIAEVDDITDTGPDGYTYLKLNTGMTEILRPSLYGSQHPIEVLTEATQLRQYVVVGHCCESGDLLTPAPGEPDFLDPRHLPEAAIGDLVLIGGAGAYCASMSAAGYNDFPRAVEVMI